MTEKDATTPTKSLEKYKSLLLMMAPRPEKKEPQPSTSKCPHKKKNVIISDSTALTEASASTSNNNHQNCVKLKPPSAVTVTCAESVAVTFPLCVGVEEESSRSKTAKEEQEHHGHARGHEGLGQDLDLLPIKKRRLKQFNFDVNFKPATPDVQKDLSEEHSTFSISSTSQITHSDKRDKQHEMEDTNSNSSISKRTYSFDYQEAEPLFLNGTQIDHALFRFTTNPPTPQIHQEEDEQGQGEEEDLNTGGIDMDTLSAPPTPGMPPSAQVQKTFIDIDSQRWWDKANVTFLKTKPSKNRRGPKLPYSTSVNYDDDDPRSQKYQDFLQEKYPEMNFSKSPFFRSHLTLTTTQLKKKKWKEPNNIFEKVGIMNPKGKSPTTDLSLPLPPWVSLDAMKEFDILKERERSVIRKRK